MRYQVIALTLTIAAALSLSPARAGHYQKERYLEDTVEADNKPVKIMIDSDTGRVAYFWDDGAHGWADVSLYPADLNGIYSEKITFQEMQGELDEMKDETWDDRYRE